MQSRTAHQQIICGSCNEPNTKHGRSDGIVSEGLTPYDNILCFRQPEDIGFSTWLDPRTNVERNDYVRIDGVDYLHYDVSGPEATDTEPTCNPLFGKEGYLTEGIAIKRNNREGVPAGSYSTDGTYYDEHEYEFPTKEHDALDRWVDKARPTADEWVCTPTLEQHRSSKMGSATEVIITRKGSISPYVTEVSSEDRNAIIEGNHGFLSIQLLDDVLTRKHHARLLNVFTKNNELRVGSVAFRQYPDGKVQAVCVHRDCQNNAAGKSSIFDPATVSREQAEAFIWATIAHGNNHAAAWFKSRPSYYKVHLLGCDLSKCDESSPTCQVVNPDRKAMDTEFLSFLKEHAAICSDSNCTCKAHIALLSPAPKEKVAA
jgi:hypothetical protein